MPKPTRPEFHCELLDRSRHDREGFFCGNVALERYLQRQAAQDVRKRVAVTYVLTSDGRTIAGYYTLSQYSIQLDDIPSDLARRLPKYPVVPATLIGRLARSTQFKGQGIGELLLLDALERSLLHSREVASAAIIVDSKENDSALRLYAKHDFIRLPNGPNRLFLPMATVEELFRSEGKPDSPSPAESTATADSAE